MITWFRVFLLLLGLTLFWAPVVYFHHQYMNNLMFLIGMIDIPSFIFVFFPALFLLFFFHKPKQLIIAIGHLAIIDATDTESYERSLRVWKHWGLFLSACGVINTIYSLIMIVNYVSDPEAILPSIHLALLTMQYGVLLATIIAFPAYLVVERRMMKAKHSH